MSDERPVDLRLLADQLRQLITDMGGLRNDMRVLTAIVLRRERTLTALLHEVAR